jgi:hypothetical protein
LNAATESESIHEYLSTGCWHGEHDYCKSMTGYGGSKRPGRCKFCDARCRCECHSEFETTEAEFDRMLAESQPAVLVVDSPPIAPGRAPAPELAPEWTSPAGPQPARVCDERSVVCVSFFEEEGLGVITAKVKCSSKVEQGGGSSRFAQVALVPDYTDGRNKEWAVVTPHLTLNMTLRGEVGDRFEVGKCYTLAFTETQQ